MKVIIFLGCFFSLTVNATIWPKSFTATFQQIHKSLINNKEKKSEGRVDYLYPGNIRLEMMGEEKVLFVSNEKKSWYYVPPFVEGEPGQCTIKSSGDMVLLRLFDMLSAKGLQSNKIYSVKEEKEAQVLTFSDKAKKEMGVAKIVISFKAKKIVFNELKSMEINYIEGKKVTLMFSSIIENATFKDKNFIFEPPANTKVDHH